MADKKKARKNLTELMNFIENAPVDDEIIAMDCNDHCEQMGTLAEQVANGADLEEILPALKEHMKFWGDCREEFLALVSVLRAEMLDELPELPELDD